MLQTQEPLPSEPRCRSGQVKSGILPETLVPKSVISRPKAYQESWDKPEVQSRPLDQSLAER